MPEIHITADPHGHGGYEETGHFGDILFEPVAPPEPDPELNPDERRFLKFAEDTQAAAPVMAHEYDEPRIARSEICVFGGWPRRHVQVGRHCPHGMLETLSEADETEQG